jgi:hypothetical protein
MCVVWKVWEWQDWKMIICDDSSVGSDTAALISYERWMIS